MTTSVCEALAGLPLPAEWAWRVEVRPRRRTLGIDVAEDGEVLFAVPLGAEPNAVAAAVRRRLPRLAAEVRKRERPAEPVKELVDGTGFAYLGRRCRLRRMYSPAADTVRLYRGWLELSAPSSDSASARELANWYMQRGSRWLAARSTPLASRMGVVAESVTAADLGNKWGACGPGKQVAVHWAVMQLPADLVDLVLVHELAHLRVSRHGPKFRQRMRLALPDADDRERRFAALEPELWRGAVR